MFKVATINNEVGDLNLLPGDFSNAGDLLSTYPMFNWIDEDEMLVIMKEVLFDEIIDKSGEYPSLYEKEWQGNGTHSYFVDDGTCSEYTMKPNESQLEELRKYDSIYLIFENN